MIKMLTRLGLFVFLMGVVALFTQPVYGASRNGASAALPTTTPTTVSTTVSTAAPATALATDPALSATVPTLVSTAAVTDSASPVATVGPQPSGLLAQEITLASIGVRNIELVSPLSSAQTSFHVPDNWQPDGVSYLSLNVQIFRSGTEVKSATAIQVSIDNQIASVFTFTQKNGDVQMFQVPLSNAMLGNTAQRSHTVQIALNARDECLANQEFHVFIRTDMSFFHFEYREMAPVNDLAKYPRPFFNNPVNEQLESAIIVLPTKYTTDDLQNAAGVAAGLGLLTGNSLQLRTTTADTLSDLDQKTSNLLLIGKLGDNALIDALYNAKAFPTQLDAKGSLTVRNQPIVDTDGVVEIIANPQNAMRSILAITSRTAEGVQKATLALSGPTPVFGLNGNLALISDVRTPVPTTTNDQTTFGHLGYSDVSLSGVGTHSTEIRFSQPPGTIVTSDAYLDLEFDFSDILRSAQTTLSITLNNTPIDSLSLGTPPDPNASSLPSPTPALLSNHLRALIPPLSVRPGETNTLTIVLDVQGNWKCFPPAPSVTWLSIRATSLLNLPQQQIDLSRLPAQVSNFPAPYSATPNLQDTLIMLPDAPTASELSEMIQLAARLGSETPNGSLFQPRIGLGKLPEGVNLSTYQLIIIGRPTTNSFLAPIANKLPQPFVVGTDNLQQVIDSASYRLPPGFNIGLLQALKSPWAPDHSLLVITGTSDVGESRAMAVLTNGVYGRADLAGDVVYATANSIALANTANSKDANVLADIPLMETQSAQTGTPNAAAFSITVTPGGATVTPLPTVTPRRDVTATSIYSATPPVIVPTALPTFVPLPPEALAPETTKQPIWVTGLELLTGVVIIAAILYVAITFVRRRPKDGLQP